MASPASPAKRNPRPSRESASGSDRLDSLSHEASCLLGESLPALRSVRAMSRLDRALAGVAWLLAGMVLGVAYLYLASR